MTLKTIIIDDEPLAHQVILNHVKQLTQLKIIAQFYNPLQAMEFMNREAVDLCLLDINMPKLSGLEFLQTLVNPPLVIITTAYKEYALESYEHNVCDYLVKPIELKRFIKAINKAASQHSLLQKIHVPERKTPIPSEDKTILIKGDKKVHKVSFDELIYIESYGSYLKYFMANEQIIGLGKMQDMENTLPPTSFTRIHKSYIVNLSKIRSVAKNHVVIAGKELPIGNLYKNVFMHRFGNES
jgi:DNA-binding LytR/AlgR family response regulator